MTEKLEAIVETGRPVRRGVGCIVVHYAEVI